jgi:ABC-type antimicrobial peptide transport system permease subunit
LINRRVEQFLQSLITQGTVYQLGRVYEASMPLFGTRHFSLRIPQTYDPLGTNRTTYHDEIVSSGLAARRFNTLLVAAFAVAALLLAAVGTFGVMSYAVSVRARELGVRAALGANPGDLLRMLLKQGAMITGVAVTLGAIGGLMTTTALSALLYGVAPRDPRTFVAVAASLAAVGLLATWWPARRAVQLNPTIALRDE